MPQRNHRGIATAQIPQPNAATIHVIMYDPSKVNRKMGWMVKSSSVGALRSDHYPQSSCLAPKKEIGRFVASPKGVAHDWLRWGVQQLPSY